jgi:uncharacterized UPF0146 family protein
VVVPVERASFVTAVAAGAEVAPPATRPLNWLDRAKPWVAGDAITVETAAERVLVEVGCGAAAAVVVLVAGTGLVTLVGCDVVAADRRPVTVMVCGAVDATAPVTGSFAFAVSVSVASERPQREYEFSVSPLSTWAAVKVMLFPLNV